MTLGWIAGIAPVSKWEFGESMMTENHNVCTSCVDARLRPSIDVADTGICGKCGTFTDVWDIDLIRLYKDAKLSDSVIFQKLPRLRCSHLPGAKNLSLETIQGIVAGQAIASN